MPLPFIANGEQCGVFSQGFECFEMKVFFTILLWLGLAPAISQAEPSGLQPKSFMLSDFVFERPESWIWVPIEGDTSGQKLIIPGADGKEAATFLMLFYPKLHGKNDHSASTIIPRWKEQFDERTAFSTNRIDLNGQFITYVHVEGTQRSSAARKERRPNFALAGAVMEVKQGTISARVVGPNFVVAAATKDFHSMIENSLKSQ